MDNNNNNENNMMFNQNQQFNQDGGLTADQYQMMEPSNQYGQQNQYKQQVMMQGQPMDPIFNNNTNQQQQVYPQANNGMGMGQPMMPNQNNQMQMNAMLQQQMQLLQMMGMGGLQAGVPFDQDANRQLLQSDGYQKIASTNSFFIKGTHTSGCSDMLCMQGFFNKHIVKFNQYSGYTALSLDLNEPSCGASSVKGNLNDHRYGMNGEIVGKEPMYEIEHNRTCCALKCLCSWEYVFGICGFFLCSLLFPSYTKVQKDKTLQSKVTYGCCAQSATITDVDGKKKYKIKSNGGLYVGLFDENDQEVQGFCAQATEFVRQGKSRKPIGFQITMPQNLSVEDKIAILVSFSKCH